MRLEVTIRARHVGVGKVCCPGFILGAALFFLTVLFLRAEETFPVLQVGSQTYSNVTVTSKTPRYIVIMHSQGLTSIKLKELSQEVLNDLGYKVDPPAPPPRKLALPKTIEIDPKIKEMQAKAVEEVKERVNHLSTGVLYGVAAGLVALYLFTCYCFMLICKKAGYQPGVLVWVPILQLVPICKAAHMSGWWALGWFLPVVNVLVQIVWSVKICQARGKSGWLAVLLLLPVTSFFTFLYLAFADALDEDDSAPQRISF